MKVSLVKLSYRNLERVDFAIYVGELCSVLLKRRSVLGALIPKPNSLTWVCRGAL